MSSYLSREPVMLAALSALTAVLLAVAGLSHVYAAQQEAFGNRWFSRGSTEFRARHFAGAVSEINGQYGELGWVPIRYIHRSLGRPELLAYYSAAHIALITPLKDGMNLVAKEYCAARVHDDRVLILSEFAGSAFQLNRGALLVNPYDTRAVAEAIAIVCDMPTPEQRKRIRKLKARIRHKNIFLERRILGVRAACERGLRS